MRELVRRCDALKAARVQELNRQKAGFASAAVATSIAAHLDWLGRQIEAVFAEVCRLIDADPTLAKNVALVRSITGFGEISTAILLAELTPQPQSEEALSAEQQRHRPEKMP